MSRAAAAFEYFIPPAKELWKAGGADMQSIEVDPGRFVDIPFFDPVHTANPRMLEQKPFVTKHGRELGRQALYQFEIDKIDYLSRVLIPPDTARSPYNFTIIDSTAWCTTIDGYAGDRNARLFIDAQMPLIATGAPFSARRLPRLLEPLRLPSTLNNARKISLAYNAQVEQMIAAYLTRQLDLPKAQFGIGDSRADNIKAAHVPYMREHGAWLVGFDTKGHCAPDAIGLRDMPEFGSWLLATTIGGVAATACLAQHGQLETLRGTAPTNPNAVAGTLSGVLRSLASGETGRVIEWLPRQTHGIDVLYGLDSLGKAEEFVRLFKDHPNVRTKLVAGGTHGALLHPVAHTAQRPRIVRAASEFREQRADVDTMQWDYIHGLEQDNIKVEGVVEPIDDIPVSAMKAFFTRRRPESSRIAG